MSFINVVYWVDCLSVSDSPRCLSMWFIGRTVYECVIHHVVYQCGLNWGWMLLLHTPKSLITQNKHRERYTEKRFRVTHWLEDSIQKALCLSKITQLIWSRRILFCYFCKIQIIFEVAVLYMIHLILAFCSAITRIVFWKIYF